MIKYILFDLDGTLTDPMEGITNSVAYSLKCFGIETENKRELCKFIGPPLKFSYMNFYGFDSDKAEKAVGKYREYFAPKGKFENKVYDGIYELLDYLKNIGYRLAVATSKPYVYSVDILKHFNLYDYFDFVAASELDGRRTDKAEVIAYGLNNLGITSNDAIMIGDRKHDIIGAKKNNVKSIGVLWGYGGIEELKEAEAHYIVSDIKELKEILTKLRND